MGNKRTILIVDDDADLREGLVEQLSLHEEFHAIAADTGNKGVEAAKAQQIDLVIMDVELPDIDGREAVRILRKNGFKSPIIMLTAHSTESDTILGLEWGANDYVAKPFKFAVLLARIRAQLRQREPGIGQDRQRVKTGEKLAQDFQTLTGEIGLLDRQAGDVSARPR
jgi:DNA-binding response OmpR family regulator